MEILKEKFETQQIMEDKNVYGYIIEYRFPYNKDTDIVLSKWYLHHNKKFYKLLKSAEDALENYMNHNCNNHEFRIIPLYMNN